MSIDTFFSRRLLQQIIPSVRAAGKRPMKDAWVWHAGRDHWEFHGPDDFYWHGGASCAAEARYNGWSVWLEKRMAKVVLAQLSEEEAAYVMRLVEVECNENPIAAKIFERTK